MGSSGEDQPHDESTQYTVSYSHGKKKTDYMKKEELTKKSTTARVKRVVSCKRKTRHVTAARKKPSGTGRTHDAANRETNMTTDVQREMTADINNTEEADYLKPTEPTSDHILITEVLLGRNLRLKVAFTLWQRHFGEMLTYFLRIQDTAVFVDILPLIIKSLEDESSSISIGFCVDMFPLVQNVLIRPYEEYVIVGLMWLHSVVKRWRQQLKASGGPGSTEFPFDRNFQVFNQQLLELWHQEPQLKSMPGAAGESAKDIDSFLSQLT
uniref:KATNB1-like protein 1 isoform X2 n=1 Tax=Doryrhamphus excisus TaxID=161450 RepID=UPI0025AEAEC9|nr:KATNB1-like protein 1 isoform X2 [Doryrhamphus excisus]